MLAFSLFEAWKFVGADPELQRRLAASVQIVGLDEVAELLELPTERVERAIERALAEGWLTETTPRGNG